MTQSKPKGDRFERKVAKELSDWVGFSLVRAPQSGGGETALGDIVPKGDEILYILPECKHWETWDFNQILTQKGPFHFTWIPQIQSELDREAERSGLVKFPALIFTRNYTAEYIAFPERYLRFFWFIPYPHMKVNSNGENYAIVLFENFLKAVPYIKIIELVMNGHTP